MRHAGLVHDWFRRSSLLNAIFPQEISTAHLAGELLGHVIEPRSNDNQSALRLIRTTGFDEVPDFRKKSANGARTDEKTEGPVICESRAPAARPVTMNTKLEVERKRRVAILLIGLQVCSSARSTGLEGRREGT